MNTVNPENPFDLDNEAAYQAWREMKLLQRPVPPEITITDAERISADEKQAMSRHCDTQGFVVFRYAQPPADPEAALRHLGYVFGLSHIDANLCAEDTGLTEITVKQTGTDNIYIPYTDRPIGWHTDGYYNTAEQHIHGMLLYCHQPAHDGGENGLLDHEIAYIRLRDQNPEWIRALMAPDAFTIPPNVEGGKEIRPATVGPVYSVSNNGRNLHMRYSMRQRNVIWADDPVTREAAGALLELFSSDDDHIVRMTMQRGQGVLCNNILHMRSGFRDAADPALKRVMYRARYYDRVALPS